MAQNNVPDWVTRLDAKRQATAKRVIAEAQAQNFPTELALAMAMQESGFDQSKKSGSGPVGVMMLGKASAKDMGVNRHNEAENIRGGVKYGKMLLDKYKGDIDKALIAYHDGPSSDYFTTGQASPEALNHVQKVKGYAGYQPAVPTTQPTAPQGAQPMAKENQLGSGNYQVAPLDLDALDEIDKITQQNNNRFLSPFVQAGGTAGALAGAAFGQDKTKSGKKFQAEVSQSEIPMQAAQSRNLAKQAEYNADVKAHNDALKLRKELLDSAAKAQGADISNWSHGQYRGAIPFVEGQQALSQEEAGAMAREGVKKERQVQGMMPGVQFDKTTGLMLPASATPAPVPQIPQEHPLLQGLPPYPKPLVLEHVPTPKPVNPGSRFGQGANAVSGGLAGIQAADAYQRGTSNDPFGSTLGALSATGFGATASSNPKYKAIGAATGIGMGALQKLWDVFNTKDETKSVLQPTGEVPKLKKGGAVKKPAGGLPAVEHFDGGGKVGAAKAAWQLGSQQVGKLSDWAQNYLGHYFVPTQSDRMAGVGGTSFSANSLVRPEYANRAWGSGKKPTATGIANLAKDPRYGGAERQIFAPLLGTENMHQSNQIVYDELLKQHNKNLHKYSPERVAEINQYMQTGGLNTGITKQKFDPIPDFNILDQDLLKKYGDTFDTRKAIANHAFGAEGLGRTKKQIFDYQNILDDMRDPLTQGAPSFAMGPRAFKLSGEVEPIPRADLNSAYPWMLHGQDLNVTYQPVPSELALRDFQKQWRADTGNTMPNKSGALKQPGYYEHTVGYTPKGAPERVYPRQEITEQWIKDLQSSGFAEGGLTGLQHFDRGGIAKRLLSYVDPATKKIADWNWKPMTSVAQDVSLTEVPDYIQKGYGGFMQQQANKALANSLSPRDLIKAYTITQSSIGRGGLSHPTATKAGLKLPNTGGEVRPEGAFSEWLGSPMGQKYLDAASKGELAPEAMEQIRQQFAPFGKQNDLVNKMQYAAETLPQMSENLNSAIVGDKDAYRKWAEQMNGVAGAKSGFIGSLLGRGDLPTFDARQINLHTAGNAPAGLSSIMQRGKGEGGREAVDRLASRQQALGLDIDPSLDPFYQHLTHHAIWDKIGNSQTTHDDLIKAMSNYAQGGLTHL